MTPSTRPHRFEVPWPRCVTDSFVLGPFTGSPRKRQSTRTFLLPSSSTKCHEASSLRQVYVQCLRKRPQPATFTDKCRAVSSTSKSSTVQVRGTKTSTPKVGSGSPVWKSTSVSGASDNSSLSHFSALMRPCWLRRAVRNRHRRAIEQASRRWRGGRRGDSGRTRRQFDFHTGLEARSTSRRRRSTHQSASGPLRESLWRRGASTRPRA